MSEAPHHTPSSRAETRRQASPATWKLAAGPGRCDTCRMQRPDAVSQTGTGMGTPR